MSAHTDAYENKLIDFHFRGQALGLANSTAAAGTGPSQWFIGLIGVAGSDASVGTELSGTGYARVAVTCNLANWAGTQGAGTTSVSSGSSGTTSNNNAVTFPTPGGAWGQAVEWGAFDSLTGGTECFRGSLAQPKTINAGDPAPYFLPGTLTYQNDN
jgi:hypothetical protein